MTPLPLAVLLYIPFVGASLSSTNGTSSSMLDVSDSPSSSTTRTLSDIIWNCVATLFACTWTAIHPNIPGIGEGRIAIASRRLFMMVIALFAPELIITWAARQFSSALNTKNHINNTFGEDQDIGEEITLSGIPHSDERNIASPSATQIVGGKFTGWTMTHGFFAWMGGFLLYVDGRPRATLTPDELGDFVRERFVDMHDITEADIEDRSKGDMLSKGIAILQLVWFVLQLGARYVQNLPITLLEIDTLAVAALTCITYGCWWKTPKDVGRPCPVHWKPTASPPGDSDLVYDQADAKLVAGDQSYICYLIYPFLSLTGYESIISPRAVQSLRVPSLGGYYVETHNGVVLLIGCFSELIITWAARQFFSARMAANDFNDALRLQVAGSNGHYPHIAGSTLPSPSAAQVTGHKFKGWTATHGFFAWMGGFLLCANDTRRVTLTPDELLRFVGDGSVDMPCISRADIEDRSKGDALSKGISILQLVWFVASLLARYIQNLPITLLEIDTLAVAALTCIAYSLWWKKPKDVGRPYLVHWKAAASPPSDLGYEYVVNMLASHSSNLSVL
ncbi:hypothetical protein AZE42_06031 [Rhizopogon vesiculosus]|uniref:Uncharacterized protein n=1 Tax=Rhizopogon vesiculosus TaxID=180088 RepID=A0A1J8QJ70_9AGAM|nr:hypothetical protein AZE42_06031 [Rhizopogon vesiculosus]